MILELSGAQTGVIHSLTMSALASIQREERRVAELEAQCAYAKRQLEAAVLAHRPAILEEWSRQYGAHVVQLLLAQGADRSPAPEKPEVDEEVIMADLTPDRDHGSTARQVQSDEEASYSDTEEGVQVVVTPDKPRPKNLCTWQDNRGTPCRNVATHFFGRGASLHFGCCDTHTCPHCHIRKTEHGRNTLSCRECRGSSHKKKVSPFVKKISPVRVHRPATRQTKTMPKE